MEGRDSLAVDLAMHALEREASERYKGFVVRNRLKRVSNEAVRCNAFMHKEELRRFPYRYIEFLKSRDGCVLRSNCEMREAFWVHFRDRFARYRELLVQEFCSYLVDFPCLGTAETPSCQDMVTECVYMPFHFIRVLSRSFFIERMMYFGDCCAPDDAKVYLLYRMMRIVVSSGSLE